MCIRDRYQITSAADTEPTPVVEIPDVPLDYRDRYQLLTGNSLRDCPKCGRGHMLRIETFLPGTLPRGPPRHG